MSSPSGLAISDEHREALEIEQKILRAWQASGNSRHLSEFAAQICGSRYTWTIKQLIGGMADIEVHLVNQAVAPSGATLTEAFTVPAEDGDRTTVGVAIVWTCAPGEEEALLARVEAWRAAAIEKGSFP